MEKIEITKEDFRKAVLDVTDDLMKNEKISGHAKMLFPMIGMMFAKDLEDKLFGTKED